MYPFQPEGWRVGNLYKFLDFNCECASNSNSFVLWNIPRIRRSETSRQLIRRQCTNMWDCHKGEEELWPLAAFKKQPRPSLCCQSDSKEDTGNKSSPLKTPEARARWSLLPSPWRRSWWLPRLMLSPSVSWISLPLLSQVLTQYFVG